jgi:hypothetical protein
VVTAPRFSRKFRRLCHVAALAGTDRLQTVLDGLLPVVMVYDDRPWRSADDWAEAIEELFGLRLAEADLVGAQERAINAGVLVYNSFAKTYTLSSSARAATLERIEAGETLEREAQESWLTELSENLANVTSNSLWDCLLRYAGRMLLQHGAAAIELFAGRDSDSDASDDAPSAILKQAIQDAQLEASLFSDIAVAIATFFDGRSAVRTRYVVELADSMFSLFALGVDTDTRSVLVSNLPALTIFVDTNVIFGVVGAHQAPSAAAAADLFNIIRDNSLPFKLYYHEKTLNELDRTISGIGDRLKRRRWTPAISRVLLNIPHAISSIEVKFHELNSTTPTSPDIFLSRYSSLPGLLAEYGLVIYRDPTSGSEGEVNRRASLVAEYKAFARAERPKDREKPYSALDHDISIWVAGLAKRTSTNKGPLFSGSLILSADRLFQRFDREVLAPEYAERRNLVVFPHSLMQALRPFTTSTQDFDQTFMATFASADFRGIGSGMEEAVTSVAAYLATYADLPEATATKLLSNSLLMSKVHGLNEKSDEFRHAVDDALVQENEALTRERDAIQSELQGAREQSGQTVAQLEEQTRHSVARVAELEARLAQVDATAQETERMLRTDLQRQRDELDKLSRDRDASIRRRRWYSAVVGVAAIIVSSIILGYVRPPHWLATHQNRLGLVVSTDVCLASGVVAVADRRALKVALTVFAAALCALLTIISRIL